MPASDDDGDHRDDHDALVLDVDFDIGGGGKATEGKNNIIEVIFVEAATTPIWCCWWWQRRRRLSYYHSDHVVVVVLVVVYVVVVVVVVVVGWLLSLLQGVYLCAVPACSARLLAMTSTSTSCHYCECASWKGRRIRTNHELQSRYSGKHRALTVYILQHMDRTYHSVLNTRCTLHVKTTEIFSG